MTEPGAKRKWPEHNDKVRASGGGVRGEKASVGAEILLDSDS